MVNRVGKLKHNPFGVKQGIFSAFKNPDKYMSSKKEVEYQSGMELKFCMVCDSNSRVIKWMNEPFTIQYWNPIKKRNANYYPDFYMEVLQSDGRIRKLVIEVKPMDLTPQSLVRPSKYAPKKTWNTYHNKLKQIIINKAKWEASVKYCNLRGWSYIFITETFFETFK